MDKNKILFGILIVVIAALLVSVSSAAFPFFGKQTAKLNIISNETLNSGDDFEVNLTDEKGNGIFNQSINITITDEDGIKENNSVITDENGTAKLKIDKDAGKYEVNCTFEGNDDFEKCNVSQNLTVENVYEEVSSDTDSYDYGAFYSEQEGRTIYTGEVHYAPDGNRYRHLGYNEWELVE